MGVCVSACLRMHYKELRIVHSIVNCTQPDTFKNDEVHIAMQSYMANTII